MGHNVIFLDVDGTLTDYENHIPASAVHAIRQARANGHLLHLRRSKAEVMRRSGRSVDGMIGGNGCYVEHHGKVVFEQTLSEQQERAVVDWLQARRLEFYLECNSGLYASAHLEERGEPTIRLINNAKEPLRMLGRRAPGVSGDDLWCGPVSRDVNKISFILRATGFSDAQAAFPDLKAGTWGGKGEIALFGDLGVPAVDKAVAIDRLLEAGHAKREDTIAFGDAKVDIPMFEYCAIGVAMGSGGEEAKAAADYVTDAVDQDGLYHAFRHFHLIEA
ncbi:MAG: HAD hydrolase family protein [Merdibacter sp.]